MRCKIEAVHRARDIQVAVGIESAHKAACVRFEIALNGELGCKRAVLLFRGGLTPEALAPLMSGAIRHHAELARDTHTRRWRLFVRVSAAAPVGVAQNGLTLN